MKQIIVDNLLTDYYITETGECYSNKTKQFLKGQISNSGYRNFNLTLPNGRKKRLYAHRLVALTYIDNPLNLREVNHVDGNKLNNNKDNLEWISSSDNQKHRYYTLEKGIKTIVYCFDKDKKLITSYPSINKAAKSLKISYSVIQQEIHSEEKNLICGYYLNDEEDNDFIIKKKVNAGKAKTVGQYDLSGNLLHTFSSTGEAAKIINGQHSHIGECCRGRIKTYKGFVWKYL